MTEAGTKGWDIMGMFVLALTIAVAIVLANWISKKVAV